MEENNKIPIYTDNDGLTKIDEKLEEDTLWPVSYTHLTLPTKA